MSAPRGDRHELSAHPTKSRHGRATHVVPLRALLVSLVLLAGACIMEPNERHFPWTCENTRPALSGSWGGTLDGAEITLYVVERECGGSLTYPYVGWPLEGNWSWKGLEGSIDGGGPQVAEFLNGPNDPARTLTYTLTLRRGVSSVSLVIADLPAGSTITAELSGAWETLPTPTPGTLVLHRR